MRNTKLLTITTLSLVSLLLPELASAATINLTTIREVICAFVNAFTGNIAVGIATLAIIFLGIGAFFGKVNWGLGITAIVGIVVIFSAAEIVGRIAGAASTVSITGCDNAIY